MYKHFENYYWKMGKPYGKGTTDSSAETSYKIIVDPYFKRFSIEKYRYGTFEVILYDSLLLDFRHLKPINQNAWDRIELTDALETTPAHLKKSLIKNQDDRIILKEEHFYEKERSKSCRLYSIHGILLSTHRLYYTDLGDSFNGVILFDVEERPVMMKRYEFNSERQDFTDLIEEVWDMEFFKI
jgi:hypothetical protein